MKVNNNFKKVAIKAAKKAGDFLIKNFDSYHKFSLKKDKSIFSKIDLEAEKKIMSLIKKNFPSHNIFAEESGGKIEKEHTWVIDALDGTTNYVSSVPVFSVSIALFCKKEPVLAAIYNPSTKKLFFSEKGKGFFVNNKKINKKAFSDNVLVLNKGKGEKNLIKMAEILRRSAGSFRTFRVLGCGCRNFNG